MALKGLIKKIASPVILASSLAIGSLAYSPETANAQQISSSNLRGYGNAFNSFGRLYRSGLLPAKTLDDVKFQVGMSNVMGFLSDYSYSQAADQDFRILREEIRRNRVLEREVRQVDINQIPQTFISNYWKDFDKDGHAQIKEFVGLNKQVFRSNESFRFGMYLPMDIKGKSYKMEVQDPKGESVFKESGFLRKNRYVESAYLNLGVVLDRRGPGTYAIAFSLNGRPWEKREFQLIKGNVPKRNNQKQFPETFLANWKDLNGDKKPDYNELEIKTRFIEGDPITIIRDSKNKYAGKTWENKIFDENDRLLITDKEDFSKYSRWWSDPSHEIRGLKPGKYYAVFKLDGKYWNDINFEVVPNPRKSSDPLGTGLAIENPPKKVKPKPKENPDITFEEIDD